MKISLDNNTKYILECLIVCLAIVAGVFAFFGALAWIGSPTEFTIKFEMDNNTLEGIKSMNNFYSQNVTCNIGKDIPKDKVPFNQFSINITVLK